MSTPKEQFDAMLDDLDDESKFAMVSHLLGNFARFYANECPTDYRCGLADFQAQCDECNHEFWADDSDEEAICSVCREEAEEEEEGL